MYKVIKTTLDLASISLINRTKCDGVEIQLLNEISDFELLKSIEKQIISMHIDLPKQTEGIESELLLDLGHWLINKFEYFKKVCSYAVKYNSAVVVHGFVDYRELTKFNTIEEKIQELDELFPTLKICLENTGELAYTARKPYFIRTEELPDVVKFLNEYSKHEMFYSLLDICHYYMEFSTEVWHSSKPLAEIINLYNSNYQLMHFNYGLGDCYGKKHSLNFNENKELLHNLLDAIFKINNNSYLILEIIEDDYVHRPNMLKLLEDIYDWEKTKKEK